MVERSIVIPVLDFSPHSPYNIRTLLDDLDSVQGEVICIFNSPEVFESLRFHERIDKFAFNKLNAGVTRSWNMGLHLSQGRAVFIMNADVHVESSAMEEMEQYLFGLPRAVIVGPQGSLIDFKNFRVLRYFERGKFSEPVRSHDVSGFLFAIHRERFFKHRLIYDDRFSPCFCEEWDMGLQVIQAELACYAVPVTGFDHHWGVSAARENTAIGYFGKTVYRNDILRENQEKFLAKWFGETRKGEAVGLQGKERISPLETPEQPFYLGLVSGRNYGWGVCSRYLIQELSKKTAVQVLADSPSPANGRLNGKLFQALLDVDFNPMLKGYRGKENYGYTFFENELTEKAVQEAKQLDLVLGGSSWCRDRMLERGISNCEVLIQGIDPDVFFPIQQKTDRGRFTVFSGGKLELRKGQDLVIKAIQILQKKYPDIFLVNCWYNIWPESLKLMAHSRHIRFEYREGPWQEAMDHLYRINGLDHSRITTYGLVSNERQPEIYDGTDIGVFPNRCEGGTNLVLMEYMACAKPVVASYTSGHRDVLTEENALLLSSLADFNIVGPRGEPIARWQEPSVEELVAQIEYAYHHREAIRKLGNRAGEDMKRFTWEQTAERLLEIING